MLLRESEEANARNLMCDVGGQQVMRMHFDVRAFEPHEISVRQAENLQFFLQHA